MSTFDSKGVWGPAFDLILNRSDDRSVEERSQLLSDNYQKLSLSKVEPKFRKEFCDLYNSRLLRDEEVVDTPFFQSMTVESTPLHDRVKSIIIPLMIKQTPLVTQTDISDKILEWSTSFVESYISQSQLEEQCELQETLSNKEINDLRGTIGFNLYQQVLKKEITEKDLDALLNVLRSDHPVGILDLASRYQTLSSKEINDLRETISSDLYQQVLKKEITEKDLDALSSVFQSDHPVGVLDLASQYETLFQMAGEHYTLLAQNVITSLDTTFRTKFFS